MPAQGRCARNVCGPPAVTRVGPDCRCGTANTTTRCRPVEDSSARRTAGTGCKGQETCPAGPIPLQRTASTELCGRRARRGRAWCGRSAGARTSTRRSRGQWWLPAHAPGFRCGPGSLRDAAPPGPRPRGGHRCWRCSCPTMWAARVRLTAPDVRNRRRGGRVHHRTSRPRHWWHPGRAPGW